MLILSHRGAGVSHFAYSQARNPYLRRSEQPILHHPFTLLAEWIAGQHELGFFIPGILSHPRKSQFIVAANGKTGLALEYGLIF